jgi:hypothetical protein
LLTRVVAILLEVYLQLLDCARILEVEFVAVPQKLCHKDCVDGGGLERGHLGFDSFDLRTEVVEEAAEVTFCS